MSEKSVAIVGAEGTMGRLVQESARDRFDLIKITEESPLESLENPPDVMIDFSVPESAIKAAEYGARHGVPLVSGTTGLSSEQFERLKQLSSEVAILYASNFSIGIAALNKALLMLARALPDWDTEVIEFHHRRKKDAPSGTALTLGKTIAEGRGQEFEKVANFSRTSDPRPREKDEIGFQSLRAGNIVGEHTVLLSSDNERIELTHRASNRKIFADGAVQAALWLVDRPAGFYTIHDVIDFSKL